MIEFSSYDQDTLRGNLERQKILDVKVLIEQGRWPPTWYEADFAIQNDEGNLLSAIADNAGLPWHSGVPSICKQVLNALGMIAIGNAKATVKRCIELGYVRARPDKSQGIIMLDLTDLGAAMLELWEDDNNLRAGDD